MATPLSRVDLDLVLAQTRELWRRCGPARLYHGRDGVLRVLAGESFCHVNRELELGARATVLTRDPARFAAKARIWRAIRR